MKKSLFIALAIVLAFGLVSITGCEKTDDGEVTVNEAPASVDLCVKCGQVKGSESCCKPDAVKCDKCGLAKGSPGCCAIPKDAESASLCKKCGQLTGSETCCKPDAEKCPKCELAKGSPGWCKI